MKFFLDREIVCNGGDINDPKPIGILLISAAILCAIYIVTNMVLFINFVKNNQTIFGPQTPFLFPTIEFMISSTIISWTTISLYRVFIK